MLPYDQEAILSRQRAAEDAITLFKKRPGFAAVQVQVMRKSREWEVGLSAQEKLPASPQRLLAIIRLLDIRAQAFLAFVEDIESQELFAAMVHAFVDQAWQAYVGVAVPPMDGDSNYKSIDDRRWHWVSESYACVDAKEKELAQQNAIVPTQAPGRPKVFLSYSYDNEAHKAWVLNLATRLKASEINVLMDRFDLKFGFPTAHYMETSVANSDFVLVICTEQYKKRFDSGEGGAGYEGYLITSEMIEKVGTGKFIPVLRGGDWKASMPVALKGLYGADFRTDSRDVYHELVSHLDGRTITHETAESSTVATTAAPTAPADPRESGSLELSPDDIALIATKRGDHLEVWLRNDTLEPVAECSITLTNLQTYSEGRKDFHRNPFKDITLLRSQTVLGGHGSHEAAQLASFRYTHKRDLLIASSVSFTTPVTLMVELKVATVTASRTEVRFIRWNPGEAPEFVDDPRLAKSDARDLATSIGDNLYWEQRKRLPDSPLLNKIWKQPHWRIWSRPEEYKTARFQNIDSCRQFVLNSYVQSKSPWGSYPWVSKSPQWGEEAVSDEIEHEENGFRHMERWLLFQTAQFVQHMALDDVSQLGSRTHIFEILDTVTGLFEFIGRMADRGVISDRAIVSCRLLKVAGRELVWPDAPNGLSPNGWCQDDEIVIEYGYQVQDLKESRRNIAVEVAMEIYMRFGWSNPPQEELKQIQSQRFGSPLRT